MKKIIFTNVLLLLLSQAVQASPVSVGTINDIYAANTLLGSSSSSACETTQDQNNCDFILTGPTQLLTDSELAAVVTTDPSTYVLSPFKNETYFDLGFSDYDIYTGAGNDLVIFIVGNATSFGLDVFDDLGNVINSNVYTVATPTFNNDGSVLDAGNTVFDKNGDWLCVNSMDAICTGGAALSALFYDFGDDGTQIGSIRISLGENFIGESGTRPRFSMAGGFHTEAPIVVPLPLASILFGSGIALLGWIGRRKSA